MRHKATRGGVEARPIFLIPTSKSRAVVCDILACRCYRHAAVMLHCRVGTGVVWNVGVAVLRIITQASNNEQNRSD